MTGTAEYQRSYRATDAGKLRLRAIRRAENQFLIEMKKLHPERWRAALHDARDVMGVNDLPDMRGRQPRPRKLTVEQVAEIRASGEPGNVLAARFGVSATNISLIKRGKIWRQAGAASTSESSMVQTVDIGASLVVL